MAAPQRVLITGATGMLGAAMLSAWHRRVDLYATAGSASDRPLPEGVAFLSFSLEDMSFAPLTEFCDPEIIIHCAAATDHAWCENNPNRARAVNALAPVKLASLFPQAYFIQISTDAVFGPEAIFPAETFPAVPKSVYGKTKREAEALLLEKQPNAVVLRTTIVGLGGRRRSPGFAEWALASVKAGRTTGLYVDALFTPVSIWDFADLLEWILAHRPCGVLHAGGSQVISKYDFGVRLARACGLDASPIMRAKLATPGMEKRIDQSLDSHRLASMRGMPLPDAERCIASIARRYPSLRPEVIETCLQ